MATVRLPGLGWALGWAWTFLHFASPPASPVTVAINSNISSDADGKFKRPLQTEVSSRAGVNRGHGEEWALGEVGSAGGQPPRQAIDLQRRLLHVVEEPAVPGTLGIEGQ